MKNDLSQLFDEAVPEEMEPLLADTQAPALPRATIARIQKKVRSTTHLHKKRPFPLRKLVAVAACLALLLGVMSLSFDGGDGIVTRPGILTVTVYAADQEETTLSLNAVLPYQYEDWLFVNWAPGLPIVLSLAEDKAPSDQISFQITVDGGDVFVGEDGSTSITPGIARKMDSTFEVSNNTAIFWSQFTSADTFWQDKQNVYMDIVILDGETIIGYNCLHFERTDPDSFTYRLSMVAAISFDCEQQITHDILDDYIAQAHVY